MVHIAFQTADTAPRRFVVEVRREGEWVEVVKVDANRHRWHVLGLSEPVTADALRVSEDEPAAVCEIRVYREPQRLVEVAQRAHANMRAPDEGPWLPWGDEDRSVPGIDPKKLAGVVFDDTTAQRFGSWVHSTWSDHYVGEGYLHDGDEGKGLKTLRFRPQVAEAGRYEMRLGYHAYRNRASRVTVTVRTGKTSTTVHLNQREKPPINDLFAPLGTFDLEAGAEVVVEVSNSDTDGYVVADCVQVVRE
jgi:hypothetical protein